VVTRGPPNMVKRQVVIFKTSLFMRDLNSFKLVYSIVLRCTARNADSAVT
jgi:hypothetical protein